MSTSEIITQASSATSTKTPNTPNVKLLLSDLKVLVAYQSASDWQEKKAMDRAFNALSWTDPSVLSSMPKYLSSSNQTKQKIDYAFNALYPKPVDPRDTNMTLMSMWIKARLFYYNSTSPFQFNPYA